MPQPQVFPDLSTPVVSPSTGVLSLEWARFFITLFSRTGGAIGNNSSSFNYPETSGNAGQVLTSAGLSKPSIWTTLATKLSQFVNDTGFITIDALQGFSTPASVQGQIDDTNTLNLSRQLPPPDSTTGAVGNSTKVARADHSHPREKSPTYAGLVTAHAFSNGAAWLSGDGAPSVVAVPGSLYSRLDGGIGTHLYVSAGGGVWNPVAGV